MKQMNLLKRAGTAALIIYLVYPLVWAVYLWLNGSLGMTFFGTFVPITLPEGIPLVYLAWLQRTWIAAAVLLVLWTGVYIYIRKRIRDNGRPTRS